jgi:hypothetical protein
MSDIVFPAALASPASLVNAAVLVAPGTSRSIVHPLDDLPEEKLYRPELGRMRMTGSVRCALLLLQAYLAAMVLLLGWRLFTTM